MEIDAGSAFMVPTMSPRYTAYLRSYLLACKADVEDIFIECGLTVARDEECILSSSVAIVSHVFEVAAKRLNDPYFGVHMAQNFPYEASGLRILASFAAPTVEAGLQTMVHYGKFINPGISYSLVPGAKQSELRIKLIDPQNKPHEQLTEHIMANIIDVLVRASGRPVPALEVCFMHTTSKSHQILEKAFGGPIKFGQSRNKITIDNAYLKEPLVTANSMLYEILIKAMQTYYSSNSEQYNLQETVYREVIHQMPTQTPSVESVAQGLSISARTLRRKLLEDDNSFQHILKMARESRAKYFLAQTNMSLSGVALELGYSELSAFSRAFRTWCGETPQAYRTRAKLELSKTDA